MYKLEDIVKLWIYKKHNGAKLKVFSIMERKYVYLGFLKDAPRSVLTMPVRNFDTTTMCDRCTPVFIVEV